MSSNLTPKQLIQIFQDIIEAPPGSTAKGNPRNGPVRDIREVCRRMQKYTPFSKQEIIEIWELAERACKQAGAGAGKAKKKKSSGKKYKKSSDWFKFYKNAVGNSIGDCSGCGAPICKGDYVARDFRHPTLDLRYCINCLQTNEELMNEANKSGLYYNTFIKKSKELKLSIEHKDLMADKDNDFYENEEDFSFDIIPTE